ncbi:hypothetical protein HanRHA438_Chr15g0711361 [Helianthus annuus]|nr:hypothetical protein HanIR_Chr04g0168501 [Helianthus annuus]KAJ0845238.1 hypothetical protein HanRHA438_Chr15g0711361 [Helianthus annuus]
MKDAQLRKNERQHMISALVTPRWRSLNWVRNSTLHSNEYRRWKLISKLSKTTSSLSWEFGVTSLRHCSRRNCRSYETRWRIVFEIVTTASWT